MASLLVGLGLGLAGQAQVTYQLLRSLGVGPASTGRPDGGLTVSADGWLYGTTSGGGTNNQGTLYRVREDGSGFTVVRHFAGPDGAAPTGALLVLADNYVYGVTSIQGPSTNGVIYRVRPNGSEFQVIHGFAGGGAQGANPFGGLATAPNNLLYGTTGHGGASGGGVIFSVGRNGTGFTLLHQFGGANGGVRPHGQLLRASDGMLYGVTQQGGNHGAGVIYRISETGANYEQLHHFHPTTGGGFPGTGLMEASNGLLYGVTAAGGQFDLGVLYRLNRNGSGFTVLYHFGADQMVLGARPFARPVEAPGGLLYGTTYMGGAGYGVVFSCGLDGSNYKVERELKMDPDHGEAGTAYAGLVLTGNNDLVFTALNGGVWSHGALVKYQPADGDSEAIQHFSAVGEDASNPYAALMEGTDGFLYGTAGRGGADGHGAVFRMRKDGSDYRVLHSFDEGAGDGTNPAAPVVQGPDGRLYGTTAFGGAHEGGTVFAIRTDGAGHVDLHHFQPVTDGATSSGELLIGSDGWMYGTTGERGLGNGGTCFALRTDGTGFRVLRSFNPDQDGANPARGLVFGPDGRLYGVTSGGPGATGRGTIFRMDTQGGNYERVRTFAGGTNDGRLPFSRLILASDGYFYGVTLMGGRNDSGVLYRIRPDGTQYQVIHHMSRSDGPGAFPRGDLVEWTDGRLYGTASAGGPAFQGSVFSLAKDGSDFQVHHSFQVEGIDGALPRAGLFLASDGALYGTTEQGGVTGGGTVFRLTDSSRIRIQLIQLQGGVLRIHARGAAGGNYALARSPAVGQAAGWESTAEIRADAEGRVTFEDPWSGAVGARFYRVEQR